MSHSREIKEKQKLQALFQTAHADTTSKISSWLKPKKVNNEPSDSSTEPALKSSHLDFLALPIISGSNGLSFENETDNVKIGEYLTSGNKKKGGDSNNVNKPQVQRNESKILEALRNKMKKSANKNMRSNQNQQNNKNNQYNSNNRTNTNASNSASNRGNNDDSDEEEEVKKTVKKKSFGLLIDSKINKKRK
ncbi:hypothetical protein WICPIJ_005156 [Wickerhamomyces pijperi]|uniref:Uncharacterized protein n=1 Tax=Wickerhamomyces pijperi TaxID=599730 RepID=A0A9P8Q4F3_WICPI|nr:hypothetical protein WICPIJ_005156 [Wickerhamomyces pijperi]